MSYAWPANLAKSKGQWIASLIDWPNVGAISDTAQGALLSASETLSQTVRDRLANGTNIPLQSELKPGQVQIPVDADASALLDKYIEDQEERRLRRTTEIERANREKRAVYLSDFQIGQAGTDRAGGQADEAAVDFASIGLKSCYLLNGGALVAIPAILKFTETGTICRSVVLGAVVAFVVGITFAIAANYLAYTSVFKAGQGHAKEGNARAADLSIAYYPPEDPSPKQAEAKSARTESKDMLERAVRLANWGTLAFGASMLAFLVGVTTIILGI